MLHIRWGKKASSYQKEIHKKYKNLLNGKATKLSKNEEQHLPPENALLVSSSFPPLLSLSLAFFFSCFIFTVGYTWCCLGLAWVSIDFSSLCSLGGCLTQGFSDTRSFVVALYSFSLSPIQSSLSYIKNVLSMPYLYINLGPTIPVTLFPQAEQSD